MKIRFKKLHPDAVAPERAHVGDCAFDARCIEGFTLKPGERISVGIGLAFELPDGYGAFVWARSGLSHKHGIQTIGGCIDSGYRGEYKIGLINLGTEAREFQAGEKLANVVIQKYEIPEFEEVNELNETMRGEGGFGSTGTH